jgi:hypothetical protein
MEQASSRLGPLVSQWAAVVAILRVPGHCQGMVEAVGGVF